ncbi:beta-lactamase family protein [Corynebacterium urealyticum]|uniref:Beta-lactamase family protein n=1 Tax=Corynebacterium urealyticum TaxID=43771 RepID=A0A5D4X8S5_9CORY|nr:beta-lactamase family protein [Corynebacterium urealyticum]TYR20735.1 beta-lactamase family protein [Corynebacterium urealyticum]TYT20453.1 beta-lactamase family protein [Corynebacterium urealyticum]UEB89604.1 serine hydrolase [Dermabacter jinjuensis]
MLEWGSVIKTVTARIVEQPHRAGTRDLSAPVSVYLPEAKPPREVDVRSRFTHAYTPSDTKPVEPTSSPPGWSADTHASESSAIRQGFGAISRRP